MKKKTLFIDLGYKVKEVVEPIYTETKCNCKPLQDLQYAINRDIKRLADFNADAIACCRLWMSIYQELKDFKYTPANDVEKQKKEEIINAVLHIGNSIAFIYPRKIKGAFNTYKDIYRVLHTSTDFETVKDAFDRSYLYAMSLNEPDFEVYEYYSSLSEHDKEDIINRYVERNKNGENQKVLDEIFNNKPKHA